MKKMNYFAAFAIMMAMGNMNAFANQNGAKHNDVHMNGKSKVEVHYDGHRGDMYGHEAHKLSRHELQKMEERRRMEEARRKEEERRRMEAHHHHAVHHNEVAVSGAGVAAGVVAGVTVAALISALAK